MTENTQMDPDKEEIESLTKLKSRLEGWIQEFDARLKTLEERLREREKREKEQSRNYAEEWKS